MELGIDIAAELPNEHDPRQILNQVRESIAAFVSNPVERMMLVLDEDSSGLSAHLHPATGPVVFDIADGELTAQGETGPAGPGYHAWVIEMLKDMSGRHGIFWDWAAGDPTGYALRRDMKALQDRWANSLKAEAAALRKRAAKSPGVALPLMMPADAPLPAEAYAASPGGYWSSGWVEAAAGARSDKLLEMAAEFFPAWHGRDRAEYWLGRANAAAWLRLGWMPPADETEVEVYKAVLGCYAVAGEIEPNLPLPEAEIKEIWTLLNGELEDGPPAPWGMGFRRVPGLRRFANRWRVTLPGYFRRETPPGIEATAFSFGDCSVHVTTVPDTDPDSSESAEQLIAARKKETAGSEDTFSFEDGPTFGWGESAPTPPYRTLSGIVACSDETCFISIVHEDTELQRDWAEKTLRSVTRDMED